ncbi:MAG: hypothetical protein V1794_01525 [Candidatus Glassbacteria bacterium]
MRKLSMLAFCVFLSVAAGRLQARDYVLGWGGRIGATLDPDQVHLGVHADLGEIAGRVRVQPNLEVGLGSDRTQIAVNPEVIYLFTARERWTPYAGGGLGINIVKFDKTAPGSDNSELEVGLNLLGGIETKISANSRFFAEVKFGIGDSPEVKFTAGFTILQ